MTEPFKSGTTDYIAIRKRMEELGLIKPVEPEKPAPVEPNAPINVPLAEDYLGCYGPWYTSIKSAVERELEYLRSRGMIA